MKHLTWVQRKQRNIVRLNVELAELRAKLQTEGSLVLPKLASKLHELALVKRQSQYYDASAKTFNLNGV